MIINHQKTKKAIASAFNTWYIIGEEGNKKPFKSLATEAIRVGYEQCKCDTVKKVDKKDF